MAVSKNHDLRREKEVSIPTFFFLTAVWVGVSTLTAFAKRAANLSEDVPKLCFRGRAAMTKHGGHFPLFSSPGLCRETENHFGAPIAKARFHIFLLPPADCVAGQKE